MCCCMSGCQICCRKSWTLILAIFENLCFAGCIYGWPSLQHVLQDGGYFDTCSNNGNLTDQMVENEPKTCQYQDSSFSLIFTMAAFAVSLSTLPNGFIYDKAGTRVSKICASILFLGAFLLFIFSTPEMPFLLYPAMILWAIGGCMLLVTNFQVANLFAAKRSTVITLLSAAFDSSAVIMMAINFGYRFGVSLQMMFIGYVCVSLLLNVNTFFLLPKSHIPYPLPDDYFYKTSSKLMEEIGLRPIDSPKGGLPNGSANRLHGYYEAYHDEYEVNHDSIDSGLAVSTYHANQDINSENNNPKAIPSVKQCVLSGLFVSHLIWMSILQHRNWFYLGTFQPWITVMADNDEDMSMTTEEKESHYTTVFAFIQLGAIFFGPLCGLIVDRNKKSTSESGWKRVSWEVSTVQGPYADLYDTVLALLVTCTLSVLFSIAIVVPMLQVQYVSFVLQVILRSFLYGLNAAFIAIAFPVEHLGTLLGVDLALAAVFGLIQFPLFKLAQSIFEGDPFWINVGLLALNFVTYAHPIYVAYYCKRETLRMRTEEVDRRRRNREAEELKIVNIISTV
ncbi:equilibrative nucleobase transporter 1-like [Glandiceps talaboti]